MIALVSVQHIKGALATMNRPQREDVIRAAASHLASSPAPHRVPKRAPTGSTVSLFFRGHPTPYTSSRTCTANEKTFTSSPPGIMAAPVLYPVDFGADPTAATDSSDAFDRVVAAALNSTHHNRPGMAKHILDLGGVTIDLQGGDYLLSRPLEIPVGFGNVHITSGTIRAAATFPASAYLIEIGGSLAGCQQMDPKQKSCNENLGFQDLMLDGQLQAAGGLRINSTMGSVVGPVRIPSAPAHFTCVSLLPLP